MSNPTTISGMLDAKGLKIAILATRFNDFIVDRLTGGALDYLERHGLDAKNITIVRIPGAFEMPLVCQKLAASGKYDGIVALGAVIRGATPHFDYVCNEASKGIAQVMLQYKTPIGFGLLTCDSIEQAIERAGSKGGNKGVEAAAAMLFRFCTGCPSPTPPRWKTCAAPSCSPPTIRRPKKASCLPVLPGIWCRACGAGAMNWTRPSAASRATGAWTAWVAWS